MGGAGVVVVFDVCCGSQLPMTDSKGSTVASDFDRDCVANDGARFGAGDVLLTMSVNHCSAFGRGFVASMGTTLKRFENITVR